MSFSKVFQTTVLGKIVRFISGGRFLKFPDEADLKGQCEKNASSSPEGTSAEAESGENTSTLVDTGTDLDPNRRQTTSDLEVVTWYGPRDPENPYVLRSFKP